NQAGALVGIDLFELASVSFSGQEAAEDQENDETDERPTEHEKTSSSDFGIGMTASIRRAAQRKGSAISRQTTQLSRHLNVWMVLLEAAETQTHRSLGCGPVKENVQSEKTAAGRACTTAVPRITVPARSPAARPRSVIYTRRRPIAFRQKKFA